MKSLRTTLIISIFFIFVSTLSYRALYDKSPPSISELTSIPEGAKFSLDRVYLINLEHSKKRLEKMQHELNRADLDFTRFSAVDGNLFKGKYQKKPEKTDWIQNLAPEKGYTYLFDAEANRHGLSIGELGNYFSHYELLKLVAAGEHQLSLILEDDALLENDFKIRLKSLVAHAPANWDIIYLNCFADLKIGCNAKKLSLTWDKRFIKLERRCTAGNGAYLINAKGAHKLLTDVLPASNRTDERIGDEFFSQKKMRFYAYCAHPELVKVGQDGSIIDEMGRHADAS